MPTAVVRARRARMWFMEHVIARGFMDEFLSRFGGSDAIR
jgi:hypothetical protein